MIKKRYDKYVANDQTLQRVLSSSSVSKYPTIGRFLPAANKQKVVFNDPAPVQAPTAPVQVVDENVSDDQDLDLLDQLVSKTIANRDDSFSNAEDQGQQVSSRAKETLLNQSQPVAELVSAEETPKQPEASIEAGVAETAPSPEMAELSKELQEVGKETKEQREQAMIAEKQQQISDLAASVTTPVAVSNKPVVVLPITEKSKEEAKFKSTKYSVKWLVEWCKKIAKVFSGAVIYKEEVEDT